MCGIVLGGLYSLCAVVYAVIFFVNPKTMHRPVRVLVLVGALIGEAAWIATLIEGRLEKAASAQAAVRNRQELADARSQIAWLAKAPTRRILALGDGDHSPFEAALANKSDAEVEVIYPRDEQEPYWLSGAIVHHLQELGWPDVSERPLTVDDIVPVREQTEETASFQDFEPAGAKKRPSGTDEGIPLWMRVGRHATDINIVTSDDRLSPAAASLKSAFGKCDLSAGHTVNASLRPGVIRIVVGSRL